MKKRPTKKRETLKVSKKTSQAILYDGEFDVEEEDWPCIYTAMNSPTTASPVMCGFSANHACYGLMKIVQMVANSLSVGDVINTVV